MDINTIIPAMMIDAGGESIHVGVLTAILIGGGRLSQLVFAPLINNRSHKKTFLLSGINLRFITLGLVAFLFLFSPDLSTNVILISIFILITIFAFGGGFATISYTDILGKSILQNRRKKFFSLKQVISSLGLLISAFAVRRILRNSIYPDNYSILFFIATGLLALASLGFWKIKEVQTEQIQIAGLKDYYNKIKSEFKSNQRLAHYLFVINTQGIVLTLMPFLILYGKKQLGAGGAEIGNYLFLKVVGGVITGSIMYYFAREARYHYILYLTSAITILILGSILGLPGSLLFPFIFLIAGFINAFHKISIQGILLEVTNDKNRAIYTGLAGAGKILPAVFSLVGGWIVEQYGFKLFFLIFLGIMTLSFYFIYRLNCQK